MTQDIVPYKPHMEGSYIMSLREIGFLNADGKCNSYYACYYGDWTYDKFYATCQRTKALPLSRGVYMPATASYEEKFVARLKRDFADFLEDNKDAFMPYTRLEEKFEYFAQEYCFSDMYKDAFNQRPHLEARFYCHALGYEVEHRILTLGGYNPTIEEDADDAIFSAEAYRAYLLARG